MSNYDENQVGNTNDILFITALRAAWDKWDEKLAITQRDSDDFKAEKTKEKNEIKANRFMQFFRKYYIKDVSKYRCKTNEAIISYCSDFLDQVELMYEMDSILRHKIWNNMIDELCFKSGKNNYYKIH